MLKPISSEFGSPYADARVKSLTLSLATGQPQAAGRYGIKYRMPIKNAQHIAISGKRMKKHSRRKLTTVSVKKAAKPPMSNAGTTPCVNASAGMSAKPYRSPKERPGIT